MTPEMALKVISKHITFKKTVRRVYWTLFYNHPPRKLTLYSSSNCFCTDQTLLTGNISVNNATNRPRITRWMYCSEPACLPSSALTNVHGLQLRCLGYNSVQFFTLYVARPIISLEETATMLRQLLHPDVVLSLETRTSWPTFP